MTKREKIIPIILAAGSSEGLRKPKALAMFGEKTAVRIAVENCAGLEPPFVVLGCDAEEVRRAVPRATQVIVNRRWREGQLTSLLCALRRTSSSAAVLIYPVDLPLLRKGIIQKLVQQFHGRRPTQQIVMPRHNETYGHPIIISSALRSELADAKSAREVVYRIPERIRVVNVQTSAIHEDFDTPESYETCLRKFRA